MQALRAVVLCLMIAVLTACNRPLSDRMALAPLNFSGTVSDRTGQIVTFFTDRGYVAVPTDMQAQFMVNGTPVSLDALTVGTTAEVHLPAVTAPIVQLTDSRVALQVDDDSRLLLPLVMVPTDVQNRTMVSVRQADGSIALVPVVQAVSLPPTQTVIVGSAFMAPSVSLGPLSIQGPINSLTSSALTIATPQGVATIPLDINPRFVVNNAVVPVGGLSVGAVTQVQLPPLSARILELHNASVLLGLTDSTTMLLPVALIPPEIQSQTLLAVRQPTGRIELLPLHQAVSVTPPQVVLLSGTPPPPTISLAAPVVLNGTVVHVGNGFLTLRQDNTPVLIPAPLASFELNGQPVTLQNLKAGQVVVARLPAGAARLVEVDDDNVVLEFDNGRVSVPGRALGHHKVTVRRSDGKTLDLPLPAALNMRKAQEATILSEVEPQLHIAPPTSSPEPGHPGRRVDPTATPPGRQDGPTEGRKVGPPATHPGHVSPPPTHRQNVAPPVTPPEPHDGPTEGRRIGPPAAPPGRQDGPTEGRHIGPPATPPGHMHNPTIAPPEDRRSGGPGQGQSSSGPGRGRSGKDK